MSIVCKSSSEIEKMRRAGHIVRQVLEATKEAVAPGRTTMDLERVAEKRIKELGAKPAFKGYYDYPCVLCTSVNSEIVHGIPSEKRVLKSGDIVSIDCGVVLDGYYGDSAITVPVGDEIKPELQKLLDVTRESLAEGIKAAVVGNTVGKPGHGPKLRDGMVIAIEPMVNMGRPETKVLDDKWTAVTEDGSYSAHFEHCIAVTKNGPVILTE
jgi:methionyl aminopeptidase